MKLGISEQGFARLSSVKKGREYSTWIPDFLDEDEKSLVRDIVSSASAAIKWDINLAAAIAVELLQDVNEHKGAEAVNNILLDLVFSSVEN